MQLKAFVFSFLILTVSYRYHIFGYQSKKPKRAKSPSFWFCPLMCNDKKNKKSKKGTDLFFISRIQPRSVTKRAVTSIGFLKPRRFLGLLLIKNPIPAVCASLILLKSAPLGKYHLMRPFLFPNQAIPQPPFQCLTPAKARL